MSPTKYAIALALGTAACAGEPAVTVSAVDARVADAVQTVVTLTFETDAPVSAAVHFGVNGARDRVAPPTPVGTTHTVTLLGLPAEADVGWEIRVDDAPVETGSVRTGALPPGIPTATTTGPRDGFLLTTHTTDAGDWVVVYDGDGRVVWYHEDTRGLSIYRAHPLADGTGIVYASAIVRGGPAPDSAFVTVSWDGAAETERPVPDVAHDFVVMDDGGLITLRYETRDGVLGNDLAAVDADGTVTPLWSAWDCWDPVAVPGDDPEHGWTHANALDRDPATGLFLVGVRNFATIAAVDLETRSCPWGFGGAAGTVALTGATFLHQHQFAWDDGEMLVFDNDGAPGNASRALAYDFDAAAGTAAQTAAYAPVPSLYSFIMGDVHRLDDGGALALYSVPGVILDFDADGAERWRLTVDEGGPLGFVSTWATAYDR